MTLKDSCPFHLQNMFIGSQDPQESCLITPSAQGLSLSLLFFFFLFQSLWTLSKEFNFKIRDNFLLKMLLNKHLQLFRKIYLDYMISRRLDFTLFKWVSKNWLYNCTLISNLKLHIDRIFSFLVKINILYVYFVFCNIHLCCRYFYEDYTFCPIFYHSNI